MGGMSWSNRHCQTFFNYITGLVRDTGLLDLVGLAAGLHNKWLTASTTNMRPFLRYAKELFSSLILASIILAYICSTASLRIFVLIVGSWKIDMLRRPPNTMPEPTSGIITAEIKNESI